MQDGDVIGIDWGTSRLRGYRIDAAGRLRARVASDDGVMRARGRFAEVLADTLRALDATDAARPVFLSGMVGSAQGWLPVPYLPLQCPLHTLGAHLQRLPTDAALGPCHIVPGYLAEHDAACGQEVDVMRGEEMQLLGVGTRDAEPRLYLLPGTHAKWVTLDGGRIRALRTEMTGELFALLQQHGTLAASMHDSVDAPQAFAAGVARAQRDSLGHALFSCRALVVSGRMPGSHARDYLSGLLIGAEWRDAMALGLDRSRVVGIIADPALAQRYAEAATQLGVAVQRHDPDATYVAALHALRQQHDAAASGRTSA